jgi:solute carrier family 25 (mitochondrial carnitine/acylcarnitine transporter), member 20/29
MDEYKSLVSGFVSGAIHTIVGFPLDTLKTLKQSNNINKNINFKNIFKGLIYPVSQVSLVNALTFGSNNYFKKNHNIYVSNLYSGIIISLICTPLDKYKITRQFNIDYQFNIKNIMKSYKNTHIVSAREIPAVFSYFSSYQYFREKNMSIFLSGSLAGTISWFITYPIDTIKTRLQNNSCKTIKEAIKKGNLFTGLNLCLIRAFIVNGVNFSVYEFVMKELNKK